jgi:chromosome partitioning protein
MGKTIVITNRKRGCGKSVTAANLGIGLAREGKKTLLIDTDNQHSLTVSMGVAEPGKLPVTLSTVIMDIIAKKDIDPTAGIIHHDEGVDLMPAHDSLTGMELTLAPLMGREIILRKYINKVKPLYDYIIIDTCPTLDVLTINALAAADSAILPVTPKYLDAKGLELLLKIIVHEGVWSERTETYKGTRTQQVDVYLKYIGKFEAPDMRTPEQIEAERRAEEKKEEHRRRNREYMRNRAAERKESERIAAEAAEQNPSREAEKAAG